MAKKAKKKSNKKKSLSQHTKELLVIAKEYLEHKQKTAGWHDKKTREIIKKKVKRMQKAVKDLAKIKLR